MGFYFKGGKGCPYHHSHPALNVSQIREATTTIDPLERNIISSIGDAHVNAGVGRNVYFVRGGTVLSRQQVATIFKRNKDSNVGLESNDDKDLNPADEMLHYFRENGASYCCLYHHTGSEELVKKAKCPPQGQLLNEAHVPSLSNATTAQAVSLTSEEQGDVENFATMHRQKMFNILSHDQELMLACAWIIPEEKQMFTLYPYVLHVDVTAQTNNENRPLLVVTGQDADGEFFTVLRAFLPNERAWVFRWLFQQVFPTLLGEENLSQVRAIVTDGDAQQTSQLDLARERSYFKRAIRVRCMWHIVNRGWRTQGPSSRYLQKNQKLYEKLRTIICSWMFSWAISGHCETKEEYIISKALFVMYVDRDVRATFGSGCASMILQFFRNHVEPHEEYFCFYRRSNILHFDTATNSGHEGMNYGIKHCAAPVLPVHSLNKSANVMFDQATMKMADKKIRVTKTNISSKLWSKYPFKDKITNLGLSLLENQDRASEKYRSQKVTFSKWIIRHERSLLEAPPTELDKEIVTLAGQGRNDLSTGPNTKISENSSGRNTCSRRW